MFSDGRWTDYFQNRLAADISIQFSFVQFPD